jgi:hypothetical protein
MSFNERFLLVVLARFSARFSLMLLEDFLDIVCLGDLSLMVTPIVGSLDGSVSPQYAVVLRPDWRDHPAHSKRACGSLATDVRSHL